MRHWTCLWIGGLLFVSAQNAARAQNGPLATTPALRSQSRQQTPARFPEARAVPPELLEPAGRPRSEPGMLPGSPDVPSEMFARDAVPAAPQLPGSHSAGRESFFRRAERPQSVRDYSWIYVESPPLREIKVHDIITIRVDEKAELTSNNRYNRTRNGNLKAELKDFIRIGETGNLVTVAANQPTIDANLQSRLNSTGQNTEAEGIRYRIAATVVDVLPNGNLVLEARKSIRTNRDVWEYSLTGMLRFEDVDANNSASSEDIANLHIEKNMQGKVSDSTQRAWGILLYDWLSPF